MRLVRVRFRHYKISRENPITNTIFLARHLGLRTRIATALPSRNFLLILTANLICSGDTVEHLILCSGSPKYAILSSSSLLSFGRKYRTLFTPCFYAFVLCFALALIDLLYICSSFSTFGNSMARVSGSQKRIISHIAEQVYRKSHHASRLRSERSRFDLPYNPEIAFKAVRLFQTNIPRPRMNFLHPSFAALFHAVIATRKASSHSRVPK